MAAQRDSKLCIILYIPGRLTGPKLLYLIPKGPRVLSWYCRTDASLACAVRASGDVCDWEYDVILET